MAGLVIVDAGPLIAFSSVGKLELLQNLFGQIMVPEAVVNETQYQNRSGASLIQSALDSGWLRSVPPSVPQPAWKEPRSLGKGEAAAIQLALQNPGALLILDDRLARREVLHFGLQIVGSVRLLVVAQERGVIEQAEEIVEQMAENGYRISPQLLEKVITFQTPSPL